MLLPLTIVMMIENKSDKKQIKHIFACDMTVNTKSQINV